ncbi:hypothetical protein [Bacillus massiliigorillae]|uniref:hypothetical protein n=1 Tax=Bacillus massiliigorillae TaxID=1243664 RepID=UPI00039B7C34|nr:hypothetical protein [Bacillus massiliigorillae]
MKKNWVKWAVGLGSITAFTGVTSILQDNQNVQDSEAKAQVATDTWKIDTDNTDLSNLKEAEKADRERTIAGLDWEDGNWNVDNTDEQATYVTPTNPYQGQIQQDNRTERS